MPAIGVTNSSLLGTALAGILSGKEFSEMKIVVNPHTPPGYDEKTDTLALPGIPLGEIEPALKERFSAFLAHEAGERGAAGWKGRQLKVPATVTGAENLKTYFEQRQHLAAGMMDVLVDKRVLDQWPGAGVDIWKEVDRDCRYPLTEIDRSYGSLGRILRWVGDGVADLAGMQRAYPYLRRELEVIAPHMPTDWTDEAAVLRASDAMKRALDLLEPSPDQPPLTTGRYGTAEQGLAETLGEAVASLPQESQSYSQTRPLQWEPRLGAGDTPAPRVVRDGLEGTDRQLVGSLSRSLAQLLRVPAPSWRHRQEYGELDMSRITDMVVRHAPNVFRRRREDITESLAVMLSVDGSGSMDGWVRLMRVLMLSTVEAVGRVGAALAVQSWDTSGVLPLKSWSEGPSDPRIPLRIRRWGGNGGTPMAEGLLAAYRALAPRPERRKLLFFVTDGDPDRHEKMDAMLPGLRADARKRNIFITAFGLGEGASRRMPEWFGQDNVLYASNVLALTQQVQSRLVSTLLREVRLTRARTL